MEWQAEPNPKPTYSPATRTLILSLQSAAHWMTRHWLWCLNGFFALLVGGAGLALAVDTTDTRLLSQPALSASHLAFVYAGDLYVCDLDGRNVRRLTSDEGI